MKKFILFLLFLFFFFLSLHILGWMKFYYSTIWYDKLLHFCAGFSVILIIFWLTNLLKQTYKLDLFYKILVSFVFLIFISISWEFFEFFIDKTFSWLPSLQLGIWDTASDLIADLIGGCFAVLFLKHKKFNFF